jgi:hypothetical protein
MKFVLIWILFIMLSNCSTVPNSSLNKTENNKEIIISNVDDKNKDFNINYQEFHGLQVGESDFGIELEYISEKNEKQTITIRYKNDENGISKITILNNQPYYFPVNQDTLNFLNNKPLKDKILQTLNKLDSQDNYKKELLKIMIKFIEGKDLKLEKQIVELMSGKKFIKFEKIDEKNFKLSVLQDGYYLELLDKSNNKKLYSKSSNFKIKKDEIGNLNTVVTLEKEYILMPEIGLGNTETINEITEYGEIYSSFNTNKSEKTLLTFLTLAYFNKFNKLEEKDGYFLETNESGKSDVKVIKTMLVKEKLVEK